MKKTIRLSSKVVIFFNVLLVCVLITACEGSVMYREKHGLINEYDVDYDIQSIRVDDDAEYHIVAVSKSGNVETIKDADIPYNIKMKYGNYTKPILRIHISDRCCGKGNYTRDGVPSVFLPFGYKIDTFDD